MMCILSGVLFICVAPHVGAVIVYKYGNDDHLLTKLFAHLGHIHGSECTEVNGYLITLIWHTAVVMLVLYMIK